MAINHPISRRQWLQYSAAGTLGLLLPVFPIQAGALDTGAILRLHPVRYIGGLIFNTVVAVITKLAEEEMVQALQTGRPLPPYQRQTRCQVACDDSQFHPPHYKAAVVLSGLAGYQAHRQRRLELLLQDPAQVARFKDMLQYLRDERLRVRLVGMEYPQLVGKDMIPDDFFTLDHYGLTPHKAEHVQALVELTGTGAFTDWSV